MEAVTIGSVKIDLSSKERALETKYHALNYPENLRLLLADYNALVNRQYAGDYDACVILVDLERALELADLTAKQRQALHLVYVEDLTQEAAGKRIGISQQAIEQHVDKAIEAIAEVYFYWCGHGEGYSIGEEAEL